MMPGWNTGMGMDFGMGFGMELESAISSASIYPAPSAAGLYGIPPAETLRIDDLLDFSNLDLLPSGAPSTDTHLLPPPPGYSTAYAGDSSGQQTGRSFTDELYIPCEEAAELEWLSNFVDDSFSEIPYSVAAGTVAFSNLQVDPAGARGARSKRSRALVAASATTWSSPSSATSSSSSSSEFPSPRPVGPGKGGGRVKGTRGEAEMETGGIRRCTHCASDKTPQWRTGPMGPKTLCNACGVRYKSGRLVPEYRPAASPTFVLTQHSNSHRKVMELRRQKEHVNSSSVRPDMLFLDYEVC